MTNKFHFLHDIKLENYKVTLQFHRSVRHSTGMKYEGIVYFNRYEVLL